ncbi:MAG: PD-(D/E)XK motif protein [Euryarchaeota archaeon]|nr:PD-(D/E)XK motif protein [Euryarchaeota archaeon]MDE1837457.1 PD-(D/E)XK motif protein [Euryarchaeota archaeon]MDE1881870.1 PD-(D/E)XK motif protein [Euryarchaeota archaeon]MDE2045577.1 PD-(D/E)XK motif protein [Thermoplasmata archaeon]
MSSVEAIVDELEALPPSSNDNWSIRTLVPSRLHLSRGMNGEYALFLEGAADAFGKLPPFHGVEYSPTITAVPTGRVFGALRLQSSDERIGNRVIAHIAYELQRRLEANPREAGEDLLRSVEWVLLLLGETEGILPPERRLGLIGECILLRRLLRIGRGSGLGPETVLDRWWGYSPARRDFAAIDVGIEVKTTVHNTRTHRMGIDQLKPEKPTERVYLYSIGMRSDPTAPKKLPDFLRDVELEMLDPVSGKEHVAAVGRFRELLKKYGYDQRFEDVYRSSQGYLAPHLEPSLFAESDLGRLKEASFVGGAPPPNASAIVYDLTVDCRSVPDADLVLLALLTSAPASYS